MAMATTGSPAPDTDPDKLFCDITGLESEIASEMKSEWAASPMPEG
jgi:hypothetical protein